MLRARFIRRVAMVAIVLGFFLLIRPAPSGLSEPKVSPAQAAALRPAPVASQEAAAGAGLLKLAGESLGAGSVTYVEGEALGWLFSAFGVDMSPNDSAQVLAELQQISEQISALQGTLNSGLQAVSCNVDTSTYSSLIDNNPSISNIQTISSKLGDMSHAADRAQMLTYVNGEGGVNDIFSQDPAMLQQIYNLTFGTTGSDGALQLYSNMLTTCHSYFNSTDSSNYLQVWNDLSGLLTAACVVDVNYYRYNASVAPSNAERMSYLTTADVDATACQGYAQAMLDLQPNVLPSSDQNTEMITCPRPSSGSPCDGSVSGTAWLWAGEAGPADCQILSFGTESTQFLCAIYFPSLNQGQWVVPPLSEIQGFFNSCANNSDPTDCIVGEGFDLTGDFQAVGVNPQNLAFWTYDPSAGVPGQEPSGWSVLGGDEPYPTGWCPASPQMTICGQVAVDGDFSGVSYDFSPAAVLSGNVTCNCFAGLLLELTESTPPCYFWCTSTWDAASAAISQGESAAADVKANPPPVPEPSSTATPQPMRLTETATPSPTDTPRATASPTESPTPTVRPTETATSTPRAIETETPRPTETVTPRPAETSPPAEAATEKPASTQPANRAGNP
jgi:hypothetical protein